MYYLMGKVNSEDKEALISFLYRVDPQTSQYYSCREVLNRGLQNNNCNILMRGYEPIKGRPLTGELILGNLENLQRLLQSIIDSNPDKVSPETKMIVGNRFFYWTPAQRMKSPLGSLISGILKIATKFPCEAQDYEEYKEQLMLATVTAGSFLNGSATNASVAMCIKLFSEYKMPLDPDAGYGAMGTHLYLQRIKSHTIENCDRAELAKYFTTVLKIDSSSSSSLFKGG